MNNSSSTKKAKDEKRVCKFFQTRAGCWRGEMCPWEHTVMPQGAITSDKALVFSAVDIEHGITLPRVGSWVIVDLTTVDSPNHVYVQFPFGVQSLEQYKTQLNKDDGYSSDSICSIENYEVMLQEVNAFYSKMTIRNVDLTEFALGEIIVAKFSEDGSWHRAKVIDTNSDDERVKVFYVDFGNKEWVKERDTRHIEERFMTMPFLAVECFLHDVEPIKRDGSWSRRAKKLLTDLTDGKTLFAHVISKGANRVIYVDMYDTSGDNEIHINHELRKAGVAKSSETSNKKVKAIQEEFNYIPG